MTRESLGARALAVALRELAAGVKEEPPGSNGGPVDKYFADLEFFRGLQRINVSRTKWCAAAACWCEEQAAEVGDLRTIARVSGIELERDATANGRAYGTFNLEREPPTIGDLAIFFAGPQGWKWARHVARVEYVEGDQFTTIGGNENDGWRRSRWPLDTRQLSTFVRVGRGS